MSRPKESDSHPRRMPVVDALRVLAEARSDGHVVITNQGASRVWPKLSQHELDFHYNPSTMGGAVPLALGMALADSSREFLVVTGDGALLMSLGSLVSVVASRATNLTVCVLDNRIYEVTGGQKTPAFGGSLDYCDFARAAGFLSVSRYDRTDALRRQIDDFLSTPGPRFASLIVDTVQPEELKSLAIPMREQTDRLMRTLSRPMAE